jgi:hypothetical protein
LKWSWRTEPLLENQIVAYQLNGERMVTTVLLIKALGGGWNPDNPMMTNGVAPLQIVAFVSSQMPANIAATDVFLDPQHKDFGTTGLRVASVLRLHRLVTLTTALIRRNLGSLSQTWQKEVDQKLAILFGLKGD